MVMATVLSEATRRALTDLSQDEEMFREAVREFSEEQVSPRVAAIDREAKLDEQLITQLFELGLMGIQIPEQYGGTASTFFTATLVVEELSRVDPSRASS